MLNLGAEAAAMAGAPDEPERNTVSLFVARLCTGDAYNGIVLPGREQNAGSVTQNCMMLWDRDPHTRRSGMTWPSLVLRVVFPFSLDFFPD